MPGGASAASGAVARARRRRRRAHRGRLGFAVARPRRRFGGPTRFAAMRSDGMLTAALGQDAEHAAADATSDRRGGRGSGPRRPPARRRPPRTPRCMRTSRLPASASTSSSNSAGDLARQQPAVLRADEAARDARRRPSASPGWRACSVGERRRFPPVIAPACRASAAGWSPARGRSTTVSPLLSTNITHRRLGEHALERGELVDAQQLAGQVRSAACTYAISLRQLLGAAAVAGTIAPLRAEAQHDREIAAADIVARAARAAAASASVTVRASHAALAPSSSMLEHLDVVLGIVVTRRHVRGHRRAPPIRERHQVRRSRRAASRPAGSTPRATSRSSRASGQGRSQG